MGCGSNGGCSSGSCSTGGGCSGGCSCSSKDKMSTIDYLVDFMNPETEKAPIVEVSFKGGTRKEFYKNEERLDIPTGTYVAVQSSTGHDVGRVSLSGILADLQMKKKKVKAKNDLLKVYRIATKNDMIRLQEARDKEEKALEKSREIAKSLGLEMKIGNVEFQGDSKKVTFYYTADGRVDFRELVKSYAKEFKAKIEMKQIGLRQEAAMVGGIGSCGRELCCSTWLTDFKMVSTNSARYQGLAINTARLSGQCGRLKCCLNYELDAYMEAFKAFPKKLNRISTKSGDAKLIKTDILKKQLFFVYEMSPTVYSLDLDEVLEIIELNKAGKKADDLVHTSDTGGGKEDENDMQSDLVGHININQLDKKKKKKNNRNKKATPNNQGNKPNNGGANKGNSKNKQGGEKPNGGQNKGGNNKPRNNRNRKNNPKANNQEKGNTPQKKTVNKGNNSPLGNKQNTPNNNQGKSNNKKRPNRNNKRKPNPNNTQNKQGKPNNNENKQQ